VGLVANDAADASLSKSDASLCDGDVALAERLSSESSRTVALNDVLIFFASGTRNPISVTAFVSVTLSILLAVEQNDAWTAELFEPCDATTVTRPLHLGWKASLVGVTVARSCDVPVAAALVTTTLAPSDSTNEQTWWTILGPVMLSAEALNEPQFGTFTRKLPPTRTTKLSSGAVSMSVKLGSDLA
jgi:hypothetical protein